ncbi:XamI family restriction endonuclease [Lentzea californiensis]|uniref:XamI family restriction endonuclease n=1 Tax=Lentzea californiensis TaxID=438851 RepID=UPI0021648515|nr:XamI family restriction endonuclease [Lentzea californiensis]MCR3746907.1 XamI restriction endonuclease [Lentzea californiensis]
MPHSFPDVPRRSPQELQRQRDIALELFRERRREEGPRAFAAACAEIEPKVLNVLEVTNNLLDLNGDVFVQDPTLWQTMRYFCAPPVSEEDLWTLVGDSKFKRVPPELAEETARAISDVLDPVRFPWVGVGAQPTVVQKSSAVLATTTLLAQRFVGTSRRGEASFRQEGAVANALERAGFGFDASRTAIDFIDVMVRGTYSRERKVGDSKCDVPTRLLDGRLLAIECKVSNGPKNGWKRVNREVGGKSSSWKGNFGSQIVTAVVLAGVFDVSCLVSVQNEHVALFWEHDLDELSSFVESTS